MDRSTDAQEPALHAMKQLATQMRKSAETAIVQAYRQSLEGMGDGPSQTNLRIFARLAAYEIRLERRIAQGELPAVEGVVEGRQQRVHAERPQPPILTLVQSAPEAAPAISPVAAPRRALPMAALISTFLLVTCAAITSWMVGNAPSSLPIPSDVVSRSTSKPALPAMPANNDRHMQREWQALAPVPLESRLVRKVPSVSTVPDDGARAHGVRPATVVAACGGLNFISRAICMNNACAQPGMTHARVCIDAVRQRRIDEARRNPTLLG